MVKKIIVFFLLINIISTVIINFGILERDVKAIYEIKQKNYILSIIYNTNSKIQQLLLDYLNFTGLNSGFSYFAPNVASNFMITFQSYSNGNSHLGILKYKNAEEKNRLNLLYDMYMDKLEFLSKDSLTESEKQTERYLNAIAKNLTLYYLNSNKIKADSIHCIIYINNELDIYQIKNGKKTFYEKFYTYSYEI
jgi:hypothetical protein